MSEWTKISERKPMDHDYPVMTWNGRKIAVADSGYMNGMPCADKQTMEDDEAITHWQSCPVKPEPPKPREFKVYLWNKVEATGIFDPQDVRLPGMVVPDTAEMITVREVLPEEEGKDLWIISAKDEVGLYHGATIYDCSQCLVPNQVEIHVREISRRESAT